MPLAIVLDLKLPVIVGWIFLRIRRLRHSFAEACTAQNVRVCAGPARSLEGITSPASGPRRTVALAATSFADVVACTLSALFACATFDEDRGPPGTVRSRS